MALVDADIWVLTETFTDRPPGPGFTAAFSPTHPDRRPDPTERWTAIWSRWPIEPLDEPAPHRRGTVAARVETPIGPLIVYGTVVAYAHERWHDDGRPARAWEVHHAEIERQAEEWRQVRRCYPELPVVVAGDFNQGRDGRRWSYGTNAARHALTDGLGAAGLHSLTDIDLVETGAITDRGHVEHICISEHLQPAGDVLAWDRTADGIQLSDHPTLAIDLTVQDSSDMKEQR